MSKITVTIDVSKIDKSRIFKNTYTKQDGTEVTEMNYTMDVVPKKETRLIKEGDTWEMRETHFVAQGQTKEEREAKADTVYIGSGVSFVDKESLIGKEYPVDDINPEDIPF